MYTKLTVPAHVNWLSVSRAGHTNCSEKLRLSKPTEMTIRWKALEDLSEVPLAF
jgi:hypothetical protein